MASTWRQYLGAMAATIILLVVGALLLTVTVDPYRMYGSAPIPGLTAIKPRAYQHSDFVKEYLIERIKPHTLLLGNSRVEIGLDPDSKVWPQEFRPVFNAAESGHDLATALVRLRHARQVAPLRLVVLAVDFPDFLGLREMDPGPDETRLLFDRSGHRNLHRQMQMWTDRLTTTLTIDAVLDSALTLLDQRPASAVTMTEAGFNPHHDYEAVARRLGYHRLFAQKYNEYRERYGKIPKPDFEAPRRYVNFRYLEEIVKIAVANDI